MSLLMQALKKAEHAKKQTDAPGDEPNKEKAEQVALGFPTLDEALAVDEPITPTAEFVTRVPEQPELTLSLSGPEPVPTHPADALRIEPQLDSTPAPATGDLSFEVPAKPAASNPQIVKSNTEQKKSPETTRQSQQLAQSVFAAKQPRQSNRIVIFGAVAIVVLLVAGAGFYYWQLTMQTQVINPISVAHTPLPPQPQPAAITPDTAGTITKPITDKQSNMALSDPTPPDSADTDRPPQSEQAMIVETANKIRINKGAQTPAANSTLMQAYQLFQANELDASLAAYKSVLKKDSGNRDAMLGVAAIALKQKQPDQAAALYSKLLDLDPADPDAIAGLVSLRGGDPQQGESQLKKVLAQNPHSGPNLFELGNLYARQSRWSEAEDAYFRAFETSPANADYAYNLAISLDRLGQSKLALDYYQKAVTLFAAVSGNFDLNAARTRIDELNNTSN